MPARATRLPNCLTSPRHVIAPGSAIVSSPRRETGTGLSYPADIKEVCHHAASVLRAKEVLVSSEQIEAGDGVVLAVDGGGSKTELVLLTTGGVPLAVARGAGSSPDRLGVEGSAALIDALYREAAAR